MRSASARSNPRRGTDPRLLQLRPIAAGERLPVARPTDGESVGERLAAAIGHLLAGPTSAEEASGINSWFSDATENQLNNVSVDEAGAAVINFADFSAIIPNASTSAGRRQLLGEIRATVFQFEEVTSAELQFDGSCADFWLWLQGICAPLVP